MSNYSGFQPNMPLGAIGRPTFMDSVQQQQQNMIFQQVKGRPVTSFEEARASMIDLDGSVFYFPDLTNHKIYTKQLNLDGTVSLKIYNEEPQYPPQQSLNNNISNPVLPNNLVTKEDLQEVINSFKQELISLRGGISNDEQQSSANDDATFNFK